MTLRSPLFCGAAAVALLVVSPAWGQAPPPPTDSVTAIARQRYQEGVTAYEAHRYEDARAAFAQAYALKRHPAVLLNLGQAELRSRHEDDAGNHLQQFLREHTTATPDQRAEAEKGIAEAKRSTGHITVSVDAAGADVSIDGTTVGKSPIVDPVFVRPGKHTVFASMQGRSGVAAIEVKAGGSAMASVALGAGGVAPVPVTPVPVTPTPVTPTAPVGPSAPPLQPVPGFQPPPPAPPPPVSGGQSMSFGEWYTHRPIAWIGTGIAILGLGMGIGGGAAAMSASSASTSDTAAIQNEIAVRHDPQNVCNPAVLAANPSLNAVYGANSPSQACPTLQGDIDHYHTGIAVMATGYALLGVGVIGTTIYAMVDWFPQRGGASSTGKSEALPIAVAPIVTPTMKGFGAVGRF